MKQPSLLLNQFAGWNPSLLDDVELVEDGAMLQLQRVPSAIRPLTSSEGTLGGFVDPRGLAVDRLGRIYVLDGGDSVVKRFDPCLQSFQVLPCIGGQGSEARQLNSPRGLAISGSDNLFIADTGNSRVAIYSIKGLVLRALLGPFRVSSTANGYEIKPAMAAPAGSSQGNCDAVAPVAQDIWSPVDVAVSLSGWIYVADYSNGLIHVFDPAFCWRRAFDGSGASSPKLKKPIRLALDRQCHIYVVQEGAASVAILDRDGARLKDITAPAAAADKFRPACVAVDDNDSIHLSGWAGVTRYDPCPDPCPDPCLDPCLGPCLDPCVAPRLRPEATAPAVVTDLIFDLSGNPIVLSGRQLAQVIPSSTFQADGTFVSGALDSGIYRCTWHRVVMDVSIGAGTQVSVETFSAEDPKSAAEVLGLPDQRWTPGATCSTVSDGRWDCLVQSTPGRYLWVRLRFHSDGQRTPAVRWMRVFYPRSSSLKYLPAAYSEDETSRQFMDQFLSIFDTLRDGIGTRITRMASYFDPASTPTVTGGGNGKDFLTWLAGWVGLSLDSHWPAANRRNLLKHAWKLYQLRGTPEGLKLHLRLYTGLDAQILEHFRLRRWMNAGSLRLGDQSALWGADVVNRLQLDVHAQLDKVQLIDTGDPLTDAFSKYAYQFTVYLPLRGRGEPDADAVALQKQVILRIIEMSKPAHTLGNLELVQPRFRIGIQSFIGKDTVIGEYPADVMEGKSRLGFDSALGPRPDEEGPPAMRIGKSTQIGTSTLLN